jgi:hypothetical protein
VCTAPGEVNAQCVPANDGADCDFSQGLYCESTAMTCQAYQIGQPGGACGGAIPTECSGGSTCYGGTCVAPAAAGAACDVALGEGCLSPDTCSGAADGGSDAGGTCGYFTAAQCK